MKKIYVLGLALSLFVISCNNKTEPQETTTPEEETSVQPLLEAEKKDDTIEVFEVGKTITLRGKILIDKSYGPPGFGENPEEDEEIRVRMFYPEKPVQFYGSDGMDQVTLEDSLVVDRLHIACYKDVFDENFKQKEYIGREVVMTATTYFSHTGHHKSRVLLSDCKVSFVDEYKPITY